MLGHTGHLTLDAIRWCHDTGITLTVLDTDGRVLLTAGAAGRDDARLRRAQAAAENATVGLNIGKAMLTAKIDGQATVAATALANPAIADTLRQLAADLAAARGLAEARAIEATASNAYFAAWPGTVLAHFAARDAAKIPDHWTYYAVRRSPITKGSPRSAADPVNAMLNYSYALAEAEARLALQALGLDPGLGIVHTDTKNRDSLALDLLEPLRPVADRIVLTLLERRHLTRDDVHETRTGGAWAFADTDSMAVVATPAGGLVPALAARTSTLRAGRASGRSPPAR